MANFNSLDFINYFINFLIKIVRYNTISTFQLIKKFPSLQPKSVKKIIGENGENLRGNNVKNESGYGFYNIKYETDLILGVNEESEAEIMELERYKKVIQKQSLLEQI